MGGANSNTVKQNSLGNDWQVVERTNHSSNIVRNVVDGRLGEEYLIPFSSNLKPAEELDIYNYRRTNNIGLVRTQGAEVQENTGGFCGGQRTAKVVTEYLPERLSTIPQFSFPESLYVLRNTLPAFREVYRKYGPIEVTEDMVGFTPNGEVRSWLNPNFALNHPDNESMVPVNRRTDQVDMVKNIFDLVEYRTENGQYPRAFSQRINGQGYLDFMVAQSLVESYGTENKINVPNYVDMGRSDYFKKQGISAYTGVPQGNNTVTTTTQSVPQPPVAQQTTTTTTITTGVAQPPLPPLPPAQVQKQASQSEPNTANLFPAPTANTGTVIPGMVRVSSASRIGQPVVAPPLVRVPSASRIVTTTTPAPPTLVRVSSASRINPVPTTIIQPSTTYMEPTFVHTTMPVSTVNTFTTGGNIVNSNFTTSTVTAGSPQIKFNYGGAATGVSSGYVTSGPTFTTGAISSSPYTSYSSGSSSYPISTGYTTTTEYTTYGTTTPISTLTGTPGLAYGGNTNGILPGGYTGTTLGSTTGPTIFGNAGYTVPASGTTFTTGTGLSALNNRFRGY